MMKRYIVSMITIVFIGFLFVCFIWPNAVVHDDGSRSIATCQILNLRSNLIQMSDVDLDMIEDKSWINKLDLKIIEQVCGLPMIITNNRLFDHTGTEVVFFADNTGTYLHRVPGEGKKFVPLSEIIIKVR